jgi:pyruvate/2-oxoglutarate dehydrogenase complex dihydrolipoamide acyltransferase (E2) component
MPKLGEAMTEGYVVEFYVADGATAVAGAPLSRVETAKAETDVDAPASGRVQHCVTPEAEYVVGTLLATIDDA